MNQLRLTTALVALALSLAPVVSAKTKKAEKFFKQGAQAEQQKDYDKAIEFYGQALRIDPNDPGYQMADRRARFKAAEVHVNDGLKLRDQQKLDEALVEFQKAFILDPSYTVSFQEIRNTEQMIKEKAAQHGNAPILSPVQKAEQAINARVKSLEGPPELRPLNNQITNLRMNNQSMRVLYETVAKLAGINVLFDSTGGELMGGGQRNFNLDLNRVTLSEALDYIALLTHTFWKAISPNAIFVAADSAQKRQEYQDQVVKVFYIQNVGAQAEFQDFFNAVRTGANMTRGLIQLPSQNALIARGTADQIAVVEKIIHDLDRPKPEVLIDVIVMETTKSTQRTLAAALANVTNGALAPGLNSNILFTPRNPVLFGNNNNNNSNNNTTNNTNTNNTNTNNTNTNNTNTNNTNTNNTNTNGTTGTGNNLSQQYISLSKLGKISTNDFSTTLPGALVEALLQDNSTRVLNRPQLRATDGGKASLKIGSKIPYVSGSLNSAVATPGSIPYATTQFQQVDVGVNMDMEPRVNGPDDISLHLKVELSQVSGNQDIAGVLQPIISQHVNEANIRLRNGEVSILGGLNQDSNSITNSGIPGLLNVPVLGYLFGSKNKQHTEDEILVALIPHIIRAPDLTAMGEEPIETGTETNFKVLRGVPNSAEVNVQQGEANPAQPPAALAPAQVAPLEHGPVSGLAPGSPPIPVQPQRPQPQQFPIQTPVQPGTAPQPAPGQTQFPGRQPLPPGVRPAPQIPNANPAPPVTGPNGQPQGQQPQGQQGQRP